MAPYACCNAPNAFCVVHIDYISYGEVWRGIGGEPESNGGDSVLEGYSYWQYLRDISQSVRMKTMLMPSHVHLWSL